MEILNRAYMEKGQINQAELLNEIKNCFVGSGGQINKRDIVVVTLDIATNIYILLLTMEQNV